MVNLNIPLSPELTDATLQPPAYVAVNAAHGTSVNARQIAPQEPLKGKDNGAGMTYELSLDIVPIELGGTGATDGQSAINNLLAFAVLPGGSLLYFDGTNWGVLKPGLEGQGLTIVDGKPEWTHASVSISQETPIITHSPIPNLPNASTLVAADKSGIVLKQADNQTAIDVDETIARTNAAQEFKSSITAQDFVETPKLYIKSLEHVAMISVADLAANRGYVIPETGANAAFVMAEGNQIIGGEKHFEDLIITGKSLESESNYEQIFPSASDTLVNCNSEQTITNKTFDGIKIETKVDFGDLYEVIWTRPAARRTYSFYDANSDGDIAIKSGVPTSGGICYGDGDVIKFTQNGSVGLPLVSEGTQAPAFLPLKENGGGTGQIEYMPGDMLIAGADGKLLKLPLGKPGQVLSVTDDGTTVHWK